MDPQTLSESSQHLDDGERQKLIADCLLLAKDTSGSISASFSLVSVEGHGTSTMV